MLHRRRPGESDSDYLSRIAPNYREIIENAKAQAVLRGRQREHRRRRSSVADARQGALLRACLDFVSSDIERTSRPN